MDDKKKQVALNKLDLALQASRDVGLYDEPKAENKTQDADEEKKKQVAMNKLGFAVQALKDIGVYDEWFGNQQTDEKQDGEKTDA